jgi:threonine synthase
MNYLSSRGHPDRKRFCEILLEGLAPDGGLYLPESYPQVDAAQLDRWRGLTYPRLASKSSRSTSTTSRPPSFWRSANAATGPRSSALPP